MEIAWMEKVVRFLKGKTCIVLTALCVLTIAACKLPYTVQNARFKKEFLWVYAEKDFNFKTAGMVQGTFTLPKNVKHNGMRFVIMFPATFRNNKWSAVVKMPYKLTLTWNGGSLKKEKAEATSDWVGIDVYFSEEEIRLLPKTQAITYVLEYEDGVYTKLLETTGLIDKLTDLEAHPESYSGFYDAVFVVAEQSTKKMP
ncbi:conserved hypothetical protein [Treponema phagedenis]|uniref:Uncharacterized protein n=2 Tax=Treponema TaxID=157 RepID=A0A0B7GV42_TREPH|nr:conserved hypothetical protein [Treponema phagedenis]